MDDYQPIENYGVIGDLTTAALAGMNGSIDFMCFPSFDSPTIFAALLDRERGGCFKISPAAGDFIQRQRYLPDTNILLTRFSGEPGIAELSDFMAMQHLGHRHNLVRRVKAVRGELDLRMECGPKFDYARCGHTVESQAENVIFIPHRNEFPALRLRSNVAMRTQNGQAVARFKLRAQETAFFILEEAGPGEARSDSPEYVSETFKETMNYWLAWSARSRYQGRWREMVGRSALTLKLMTSLPHGSIVASPTFGLPESIGGQRNWDYRYTWIRDASFTLYALMRLGYQEEAHAFLRWIEQRCQELNPERPLQVMYHLDGRKKLPEMDLEHLEGYKRSRPVRIGNAGAQQLQLDIYGELMDAVFLYDRHVAPISQDFWARIVTIVEWICRHWTEPDNGIWETRRGRKPFIYSRAMCWLAIERALKIAEERSYPTPVVKWRRVRDRIFDEVHKTFWNEKLKAFVQYRGGDSFDASEMLMPLVKFIGATDPRWQSTFHALEGDLVGDALVYRHHPDRATDETSGPDGTFDVCSFWYVQCLARAGDLKQARFIFEKMLGYANHLGLYAEQLGPRGEHLGNFPLALSHIGVISAAWYLDQRLEQQETSGSLSIEPDL